MPEPVSYNAARGPCAVCGADSPACARCRLDYYCGRNHQRRDWDRHRRGCGVLEVRVDAVVGRHVVAVKNIPAGTIILRETPLVVVPNKEASSGQAYCAACCKTLWDTWTACRRCGWPLCGAACGEADSHRPECEAFQRAKFKLSRGDVQRHAEFMWRALGMLKIVNAAKREPRVLDLQSDLVDPAPSDGVMEGSLLAVIRGAVDLLREEWRSSARWLRGTAGLNWLGEEELCRAAGRCHINGLANTVDAGSQIARSLAGDRTGQGDSGGIFSAISLLEHSCVPSAFHAESGLALLMGSSGSPADRYVIASRDLRPGDHVSIDYLEGSLRCASVRRQRLCAWGFVCHCPLCSHPTERGLHLGSVCCRACAARGEKRFVLCPFPLTEPGLWRCEACGLRPAGYDASEERAWNPAWLEEQLLEATEASDASLERFVERNLWPRGQLHPTHHLVLDAKMSIVMQAGLHRWVMPFMAGSDMPHRAEMKRAERLCEDLLAALDASGRGLSPRRLNLLQPLLVVKKVLLRLDLPVGSMTTAFGSPRATGASTAPCRAEMRAFAPRVREIEGLVNQMYAMMLPTEEQLFRKAQAKDMDMLLVLTGCKAPTVDQLQNRGVDLRGLPDLSKMKMMMGAFKAMNM